MPFDDTVHAPSELVTDEFILRPITAADAELDYEAVMETREYLRLWEQSTWPEDDFSLERNLGDMRKLEEGNATRRAFTYTVQNPDHTECVGCVYVFPIDARFLAASTVTPVGDDQWEEVEAATYFWVRASRMETGTDRRLLDALRTWLDEEWRLGRHVFVTSELFEQQVALIESSGLELRFEIIEPDTSSRFLAYG